MASLVASWWCQHAAMDVGEYLDHLRREQRRFVEVVSVADLDAPVPTCPGWSLADLLVHLGGVQRWAASIVAGRLVERPTREEREAAAKPPGVGDLVAWFTDGGDQLESALAAAPADLECWTFYPALTPLSFWARRQSQELAVHRYDAETPATTPGPLPADLAADGIDEVLLSFFGSVIGSSDVDDDGPAPVTLAVVPHDSPSSWLIALDGERLSASRGARAADCTVTGTSSDLDLFLWNRVGPDALHVEGDRTVLERLAGSYPI